MKERLQKIISSRGIASRRASEKMIDDGRITVNGITASLGDSADPDIDVIAIDGVVIQDTPDKVYVLLYKPKGYVTTLSDEKGRKNVSDLVKDTGLRLYPVGRLDLNSEGLLIMTNDGDFANKMMHPSHGIKKTYLTWVKGEKIDESIAGMSKEMDIDGYLINPAHVEVINKNNTSALLSITISEGRNRQIRKMCEQCDLYVTRLKRVKEGSISLGSLKPGEWRYLDIQEVNSLLL